VQSLVNLLDTGACKPQDGAASAGRMTAATHAHTATQSSLPLPHLGREQNPGLKVAAHGGQEGAAGHGKEVDAARVWVGRLRRTASRTSLTDTTKLAGGSPHNRSDSASSYDSKLRKRA
jgi:hypothetical protein